MRIFFLSYAHEAGLVADAGGFRKLWELARALAERDHEVTVLYPRLPGHRPLRQVPSHSYPVLDLPYLRPLTAYLGMFVQAWVLGRGWRPDVVYFRSGTNVLPLALARLLRAPAPWARRGVRRRRLRRALLPTPGRADAPRGDRPPAADHAVARGAGGGRWCHARRMAGLGPPARCRRHRALHRAGALQRGASLSQRHGRRRGAVHRRPG